jgi:excisionase family DNA binding protein
VQNFTFGVQTMKTSPQPTKTLSVAEAAEMLGISRWNAYERIKQNELPVLRFGRIIRVPRATVDSMLQGVVPGKIVAGGVDKG